MPDQAAVKAAIEQLGRTVGVSAEEFFAPGWAERITAWANPFSVAEAETAWAARRARTEEEPDHG